MNYIYMYKQMLRFEQATTCFLHQGSTTWPISAVMNYHLNIIDKQVNVYSAGTDV